VIAPEQAIEIAQALWRFTAGSAAISGDSDRLGRIAPGFLGDLTVLSVDNKFLTFRGSFFAPRAKKDPRRT
jgi:predicted amidohydrolase YtcJ